MPTYSSDAGRERRAGATASRFRVLGPPGLKATLRWAGAAVALTLLACRPGGVSTPAHGPAAMYSPLLPNPQSSQGTYNAPGVPLVQSLELGRYLTELLENHAIKRASRWGLALEPDEVHSEVVPLPHSVRWAKDLDPIEAHFNKQLPFGRRLPKVTTELRLDGARVVRHGQGLVAAAGQQEEVEAAREADDGGLARAVREPAAGAVVRRGAHARGHVEPRRVLWQRVQALGSVSSSRLGVGIGRRRRATREEADKVLGQEQRPHGVDLERLEARRGVDLGWGLFRAQHAGDGAREVQMVRLAREQLLGAARGVVDRRLVLDVAAHEAQPPRQGIGIDAATATARRL